MQEEITIAELLRHKPKDEKAGYTKDENREFAKTIRERVSALMTQTAI